jgi:flagellar biosynthesis protein FliQ
MDEGSGKRIGEPSMRSGLRRRPFLSRSGGKPKDGWTMTVEQASELIRATLVLALITSAPLLAIGLVVGLVISLFQAVTQIQEQTLVFVPKIVSMVAAAVFVMPWICQRLVEFTAAMFGEGMLP